MEPWYKRTFLWGQVNLTEDDPEKCDVDFWKEYWKKARVEGVIINCGGIVSYYQSRFSYQYRAKSLGERDYFGVWNQAARKQGLAVIDAGHYGIEHIFIDEIMEYLKENTDNIEIAGMSYDNPQHFI